MAQACISQDTAQRDIDLPRIEAKSGVSCVPPRPRRVSMAVDPFVSNAAASREDVWA